MAPSPSHGRALAIDFRDAACRLSGSISEVGPGSRVPPMTWTVPKSGGQALLDGRTLEKHIPGHIMRSEYDGTDEVAREKRADDAPADLEPNWRIDHLLSLWLVASMP